MPISGTDSAITASRLDILRLGAGRLGWPILAGVRVPKYALLDVARLGATRLNYHSSKVFIAIDGIQRAYQRPDAENFRIRDLVITDVKGHTPSRATFTAKRFTVTSGMDVVVTVGSKNNRDRWFAGQVLPLTQSYVGTPANREFQVSAIDYTWGLKKIKVTGRWFTTVAAIMAEVVAAYAPGYTLDVQDGFEDIDEFTATNEDLPTFITRLTKRGGGDWKCDYYRVIRCFVGEDTSGTAPSPLNAVHPTLLSFAVTRDPSQWITRVLIEGGGANALTEIAAGETILPVLDAAWYITAGGVVVSGPQRITYTAVSAGGGGGLVGTGAAPSSAPALALASGAGVNSGVHQYAVTFVTGAGESIVSPIASITVGALAAPSVAPTAGAPTSGTGPNPGSHDFATTNVTASGETTASPLVTKATTTTAAPVSAPTAGTPTAGAGVDDGAHDYAVTFVTSIGETTPSPISGQVTTGSSSSGSLADPVTGPTAGTPSTGGSVDPGTHKYAVTFYNAAGETTTSPLSNEITTLAASSMSNPASAPLLSSGSGGGMIADIYSWGITFANAAGETLPSPTNTILFGGPGGSMHVTRNNAAPGNATSWSLYRTVGSGSTLKLVASGIAVGTTTYHDTLADGSLGANAPSSNTTTDTHQTVGLTGIPTGPSGTTGRKIYRTAAGGSQQKLLTTISNNSATTYSDTTADASLGANIPTSNTTTTTTAFNQVPLSGIPIGDANVTSRKVYRRSGGAGLKLLTTIGNNTATTYTDSTANASLGAAAPATNTAYLQRIPLTLTPPTSPLVTSVNIYGTAAGGSQLKLIANVAPSTTSYTVVTTDAGLGANVPTVNTATANQVAVSGIPIGFAALVTARKLYRTVAGGSQLKLLATIANNTASTYTDSTADASLGANDPAGDTSGLTQPEGQTNAGSTQLVVAGTGPFSAGGGWAVIGNGEQVIRYTGVTATALTGIPATGAGAIRASIGFNSTVTAAPQLTGIPASGTGSIRFTILKGDPVNLFVQVDDLDSQADLSALLTTDEVTHDGIVEDYIQDRRLSADECELLGRARLVERGHEDVSVRYTVRDQNTRAGRMVSINLGAPISVMEDLLIQEVTISNFNPSLHPRFVATASRDRFTFEDLVRMERQKGA